MKTQKLNIKVRDLEPLKNVTGGRRRRARALQAAEGFDRSSEGRVGCGYFRIVQ
jgi:hypothetical protein